MAEQRHYHRWPRPCDYDGDDITSYWPSVQANVWSIPPALNFSFEWPKFAQLMPGTYRGSSKLKHVYPLTWGYYRTDWYPPGGVAVQLHLKFSLVEEREYNLMCAASLTLFHSFMAGGGVKEWPNQSPTERPPYSQNETMEMHHQAWPAIISTLKIYPISPEQKWETSFVPLEL